MDEIEGFAKMDVVRKSGEETLKSNGRELDVRLIDFWRWSASDLVGNTMRGVFAEYIVARALNVGGGIRTEWDAYDLQIPSGITIEVKSAAYLQSWEHRKLSNISFKIPPTRSWNATTNTLDNEVKRQADIYVFCHLTPTNKTDLDPLQLEQWDFYILPTSVLNEKYPTQKTISLSSLLNLNPCRATFEEIAACVERTAS